jgi:hemerythrin-like domain-containing protein
VATKMKTRHKTDAITLLTRDHEAVSRLFKQFRSARDDASRGRTAMKICDMLTIHATCEEELLYPEAHQAVGDDDLVFQAEVEHGTAHGLISCIRSMDASNAAFGALVTVLEEYVRHHVHEEEHELFPRLQRSGIDLEAMGAAIVARKAELGEDRSGAEYNLDEGAAA